MADPSGDGPGRRGLAGPLPVPSHWVQRPLAAGSGDAPPLVSWTVGAPELSAPRCVVVLHGFTGSALAMAEFVERMLAVSGAAAPCIVVPDLLGHGASGLGRGDAVVTMERAVDAVGDLIRSVAGNTPVDVVGYSMGGRIALSLACAYPELVDSLVTVGARPGLATEELRSARRKADRQLGERIISDGIERFAEYWEALPLWSDLARRAHPDVLAEIGAIRRACNAEGLVACLLGMGTGSMPPLGDSLAASSVPHLAIIGADDAAIVAQWSQLRDRLPSTRIALVPAAGHAAHLEQVATVAELAAGFIDGDGTSPPVQ